MIYQEMRFLDLNQKIQSQTLLRSQRKIPLSLRFKLILNNKKDRSPSNNSLTESTKRRKSHGPNNSLTPACSLLRRLRMEKSRKFQMLMLSSILLLSAGNFCLPAAHLLIFGEVKPASQLRSFSLVVLLLLQEMLPRLQDASLE